MEGTILREGDSTASLDITVNLIRVFPLGYSNKGRTFLLKDSAPVPPGMLKNSSKAWYQIYVFRKPLKDPFILPAIFLMLTGCSSAPGQEGIIIGAAAETALEPLGGIIKCFNRDYQPYFTKIPGALSTCGTYRTSAIHRKMIHQQVQYFPLGTGTWSWPSISQDMLIQYSKDLYGLRIRISPRIANAPGLNPATISLPVKVLVLGLAFLAIAGLFC